MENNLGTATVYWGCMGIMENTMETAIVYWGNRLDTTPTPEQCVKRVVVRSQHIRPHSTYYPKSYGVGRLRV